MIVADTNLLAYFFLSGDQTDLANSVHQKDPEWIAPYLWRSEFRNVLALYLRKGLLDVASAMQIMEKVEKMMANNEYHVASPMILEVIARSHLTAYDSEYVALALDIGVELVTADKKVLQAFPQTAVSLANFAGFTSHE